MATEPEIMKVSSDEFDKDPERYRVQATPSSIPSFFGDPE
jgi:hypothetical protein